MRVGVACVAVLILACFLTASCDSASSASKEWTLSDIEARIGTEIPDNASHVQYEAGGFGDLFIAIQFEVPLAEADQFARHFCNGQLAQGVNPIKEAGYIDANGEYHSGTDYRASDLEFGLSCWSPHRTWLTVDRRSGTVDQVTLHMFFQ